MRLTVIGPADGMKRTAGCSVKNRVADDHIVNRLQLGNQRRAQPDQAAGQILADKIICIADNLVLESIDGKCAERLTGGTRLSDGEMARLFNHAIDFAEPVLRPDANADFPKSVGLLADFAGFPQAAGSSQPQPVGNIVAQRAARLTIGHAALGTAAGLLHRFVMRVFIADFPKIIGTLPGRPRNRRFLANVDKSEHFVIDNENRLRGKSDCHAIL